MVVFVEIPAVNCCTYPTLASLWLVRAALCSFSSVSEERCDCSIAVGSASQVHRSEVARCDGSESTSVCESKVVFAGRSF